MNLSRLASKNLQDAVLEMPPKVSHYAASGAKVICSLGPSSQDVAVLSEMLCAGMNVARFDFSWGSRDFHQQTLDNLRLASKRESKLVATMLDTKVWDVDGGGGGGGRDLLHLMQKKTNILVQCLGSGRAHNVSTLFLVYF